MKGGVLIVFILVACITCIAGEWERLNVWPTGQDIVKIQSTDDRHVFFIGFHGDFFASDDVGITWERRSSPTYYLHDMCFLDSLHGFLLGSNSVYATSNGGRDWIDLPLPKVEEKSAFSFDGIHFIDSQNGWVVGGGENIVHTDDGGLTWEVQHHVGRGPNTKYMQDVYFLNDSIGWAVGTQKGIFYTENGGKKWISCSSVLDSLGGPFRSARCIFFTDDLNGWIGGSDWKSDEVLIKTNNGGKTWEYVIDEFLMPLSGINDICFLNSRRGWLIGRGNTVVTTLDGGETWESRQTELPSSRSAKSFNPFLQTICFINDSVGFIGGADGTVLRTHDAGDTWNLTNTGLSIEFTDAHFVDSLYGWGADYTMGIDFNPGHSRLFKTEDGGMTWSEINGSGGTIRDLSFFSRNDGWSCMGSTVKRTYDGGGESWYKRNPVGPDNKDLKIDYLVMTDTLNGWCGDYYPATVFKTTDGGRNWITQESLELRYLKHIFSVDRDHCWVAGSNADGWIVYGTWDGGNQWSAQCSDSGEIHGLYFTDSLTGWINTSNTIQVQVDSTGKYRNRKINSVQKTTDGGQTWYEDEFLSRVGIRYMTFLDSQHGWKAYDGSILYTEDGGQNWYQQQVDGKVYVKDFCIVDERHIWAVGEDGLVLRYKASSGE